MGWVTAGAVGEASANILIGYPNENVIAAPITMAATTTKRPALSSHEEPRSSS
jgi:hypothetical protein